MGEGSHRRRSGRLGPRAMMGGWSRRLRGRVVDESIDFRQGKGIWQRARSRLCRRRKELGGGGVGGRLSCVVVGIVWSDERSA